MGSEMCIRDRVYPFNTLSNWRLLFIGFFCALLLFSEQVVAQISIKGQLDRLSFSLVSILRERTQLYNSDYTVSRDDATALYTIAKNSLTRTLSSYDSNNLGATIEGLTFDDNGKSQVTRYNLGSHQCNLSKTIASYSNLSVETSWGRRDPLYRVTLCYKGANFYGAAYGGDYSEVSTSSISLGR